MFHCDLFQKMRLLSRNGSLLLHLLFYRQCPFVKVADVQIWYRLYNNTQKYCGDGAAAAIGVSAAMIKKAPK